MDAKNVIEIINAIARVFYIYLAVIVLFPLLVRFLEKLNAAGKRKFFAKEAQRYDLLLEEHDAQGLGETVDRDILLAKYSNAVREAAKVALDD